MVALSPRLLLEIDRTRRVYENQWTVQPFITTEKLAEFRRRTIENTFREIIFGSERLLMEWQATSEFVDRHQLMKDVKSYNAIVRRDGDRELWKVNAYGGVQEKAPPAPQGTGGLSS